MFLVIYNDCQRQVERGFNPPFHPCMTLKTAASFEQMQQLLASLVGQFGVSQRSSEMPISARASMLSATRRCCAKQASFATHECNKHRSEARERERESHHRSSRFVAIVTSKCRLFSTAVTLAQFFHNAKAHFYKCKCKKKGVKMSSIISYRFFSLHKICTVRFFSSGIYSISQSYQTD